MTDSLTAKTICLQKYETSTNICTLRFQSGISKKMFKLHILMYFVNLKMLWVSIGQSDIPLVGSV